MVVVSADTLHLPEPVRVDYNIEAGGPVPFN